MYQIYLGDVLFPVAPEEILIKMKNQNRRISLVNEGELNIIKSPGLSEFSMKLLLPKRQYAFSLYEGGFQRPDYFISVLERLKTERQTVAFTVLAEDSGKHINTNTTVEDYTIREDAGENGDIIVELSLLQYIHYGTKVVTIQDNAGSSEGVRPPAGNMDKSYTILDGDTLWGIARKFYGDGTRCYALYEANKAVLDGEAARRGMGAEMGDRWIFTGTTIQIP